MSCWRLRTWPGWRASACTIQNSVSDSSTTLPSHCACMRSVSSVSGPRRQHVGAGGFGLRSASTRRNSAFTRAMRCGEAQVLGEEIVGAQAQPRDRIELAVARGQKDDRQLRPTARSWRHSSKPPSGSSSQRDVDDREVRQARGESAHRLRAVGVGAHRIAFARERRGVVVADGRFVLDDGDRDASWDDKATGWACAVKANYSTPPHCATICSLPRHFCAPGRITARRA